MGRWAVAPVLVWLAYWAAFSPGAINHDVVVQWREIIQGRYDNWHPVLHTLLLRALSRPTGSLAAVSLAQVLTAGGLLAWFFARLRRRGVPRAVLAAAAIWLAAAPVFGVALISLAKDTAFALAVLWMTGLLLGIAMGEALGPWNGIALGLACALAVLLRHNGPALAIPVLAGVAWRTGRAGRSGLTVAVGVALGAVVIVRGPISQSLSVEPRPPLLVAEPLVHQLAALVHAGVPMHPEEREVLESLLPLDKWNAAYNCRDANRLLFFSGMDTTVLVERPQVIVRTWAGLAARNPRVILRHWRCVTAFVWKPHTVLYMGPTADDGMVAPNDIGLRPSPVIPGLRRPLVRLVRSTSDAASPLRVLMWQPAFALYLSLGALAVALSRARGLAPLLVWIPALANTLVWLLLPVVPAARFQWPVMLLAPLLVCSAAAKWADAGADAARPPSSRKSIGL